jgi:xyloglucan-specific endo-beta-1,4-glucanase
MRFLTFLAFALPLVVSAVPVEIEERAAAASCGQWDTIAVSSAYSILLDQWGLSGASSGSDCASLTSVSGSTVAWKNTWAWTGGTGVKSFTNLQLNTGLNQKLSAITTMPVRLLSRAYPPSSAG